MIEFELYDGILSCGMYKTPVLPRRGEHIFLPGVEFEVFDVVYVEDWNIDTHTFRPVIIGNQITVDYTKTPPDNMKSVQTMHVKLRELYNKFKQNGGI